VSATIIPIAEEYLAGWYAAVQAVAAERIYLGRVTVPPFDPERAFPLRHIEHDWPMYCAVLGDAVIGWADVTPSDIPECVHRGVLGMGVVASHRGAGLGSGLLDACIAHAPRSGISKIELTVFADNLAAIALYRKRGFLEIGVNRDYRRLDGVSQDALLMELCVP
jgi:ribosomal protein S18 acetylase RimI-like enzyme